MLIGICFVRKPSQLSRHSTCAVPRSAEHYLIVYSEQSWTGVIFELVRSHSLFQRVALLHSHLKHVIERRAADDEDLGFQYRFLTR